MKSNSWTAQSPADGIQDTDAACVVNPGRDARSFARSWLEESYMFFMRTLKERGVTFIMGSDPHNVENPGSSPFHLTWMLGVPPEDMPSLKNWLDYKRISLASYQ
jgi:hypothetical protein